MEVFGFSRHVLSKSEMSHLDVLTEQLILLQNLCLAYCAEIRLSLSLLLFMRLKKNTFRQSASNLTKYWYQKKENALRERSTGLQCILLAKTNISLHTDAHMEAHTFAEFSEYPLVISSERNLTS